MKIEEQLNLILENQSRLADIIMKFIQASSIHPEDRYQIRKLVDDFHLENKTHPVGLTLDNLKIDS